MKAAREFISDMAEHVSMPEIYVAIRQLLLNADTVIDDFVALVDAGIDIHTDPVLSLSWPRGAQDLGGRTGMHDA